MSGVVASPVSACRACLDWITVPYILLLVCVIQILHLHNQPDGHSEYEVGWCLVLCKHSTLVDRILEVDRRIAIPLPLLSDLCVISVCNLHNCVGHSTLVDRTL